MVALRYDSEDALRRNLEGKATRIVEDPPTVSTVLPSVETLFPTLRHLADATGWRVQYTYNALGPDDGLHMIFVRDVVIFAYLLEHGHRLSESQQRWVDALTQTGAEVYVWHPSDFVTIQTRLAAPRGRSRAVLS